ncbi:acyl-CoA dehydrogenase family protein [Mesonia ostreae]|uniref:Acyl-CoA dehydrogenase family protein n=1 Tax=Mesonia ostreae TaxID=861110 RepID=A0ABU2KE78_9FLAO|nr:acyl-CoA dehydrogenase family protein [Mesonia ostreae]MDT0293016.1 acyl-CoA dehydrogenase family protein [Mesonia ostreae]
MTSSKTENKKNPYPFLDSNYTIDSEDYPRDLMNKIQSSELMVLNVPSEFGGGFGKLEKSNYHILNILKGIGARDLSAGRIFEGHLNAMLLIERYGTQLQKEVYFSEAKSGVLFGIWNSQMPNEPLKLKKSEEKLKLEGSKVFCSGANNVLRPIVTAEHNGQQQMLVLDLKERKFEEDYTYWQPLGMKSSVSCRFNFTGLEITKSQFLGSPNAYFEQPDFSGGAVRFAAVQLGGAEAMIAITLAHLKEMNRTEDLNQISRMAKLALLKETGHLWLENAGLAFDNRYTNPIDCLHKANMFRTITREICEEVMSLCEMSVGLQGFLKPHPMERIHRDLSVYLKQPGPDSTLLNIGQAFIKN